MAETPINVNVDAPTVEAPISLELTGQSIIDSIRNSINDLVKSIRSGSDEALTVLMLGAMFVVAGVYVWRRV